MTHRFVPDYPTAELDTGSSITPPKLVELFGRQPTKADLGRLRDKLESIEPRLAARIVIHDGMLSVIAEGEAIRRRLKFAEGSAKASLRHATRGSEVDTSKMPPIDRKRADLEQMALQRHVVVQAGAINQLSERQLNASKT